jgi:hypothetical protein
MYSTSGKKVASCIWGIKAVTNSNPEEPASRSADVLPVS